MTRADVEAAAREGSESESMPAAPAAVSGVGSAVSSPASRSAAVVAAAQRPTGVDREEPLVGLRRQVARTMQAAWRDIPHIYSLRELDASALVAARAASARARAWWEGFAARAAPQEQQDEAGEQQHEGAGF